MFDYQPRPGLLEGRVILVTGAGDGIGRACALSCARLGATLVLAGRTQSKLEAVYDEILAAGGPEPAIVPINLEGAGEADYQQIALGLEENFGRLDGLVQNAGQLGQITPLEQYDPAIWNSVIQVNLNAAFLLSQACLPLLAKSEDASIIFTSSGVGRRGRAFWGAYAVSKFALEGLSQVLADELESQGRVRVNAVNPGATRTRMRAFAFPGEHPDDNPEPEAIMPVYLYLLGPDARGVTGLSLDAQGQGNPQRLSGAQ